MKAGRIRLECTGKEKKLLTESLMLFRNQALEAGKPTEDLDRLLGKLLRK